MKILAVRVGTSKKYVMNRGQEQRVGYAVKAKKRKIGCVKWSHGQMEPGRGITQPILFVLCINVTYKRPCPPQLQPIISQMPKIAAWFCTLERFGHLCRWCTTKCYHHQDFFALHSRSRACKNGKRKSTKSFYAMHASFLEPRQAAAPDAQTCSKRLALGCVIHRWAILHNLGPTFLTIHVGLGGDAATTTRRQGLKCWNLQRFGELSYLFSVISQPAPNFLEAAFATSSSHNNKNKYWMRLLPFHSPPDDDSMVAKVCLLWDGVILIEPLTQNLQEQGKFGRSAEMNLKV